MMTRPSPLAPQVSFGSILTPIGVFFLTYGFGAFFQILPGADIAAILLIYGFPITLLGFALSYAQLKPVPCRTTAAALALRDAQATDIQKQVGGCCSSFCVPAEVSSALSGMAAGMHAAISSLHLLISAAWPSPWAFDERHLYFWWRCKPSAEH